MQHRGISVETITNSALTIAQEEGLDALTMPNIAQALGVKSQSLYNHVSNLKQIKTQMSISLFRTLKARLLEGLLGLTGEVAIRTYFRLFYQFCLENNRMVELLFLPGNDNSTDLTQSYREIIDILHTILAGLVTSTAQIQLYTRTLMSLFVGFTLNEQNQFFKNKDKRGETGLEDVLALVMQTIR